MRTNYFTMVSLILAVLVAPLNTIRPLAVVAMQQQTAPQLIGE